MTTIQTSTAITTPARRIARTTGTYKPIFTLAFDAAGELLDAHLAALRYDTRQDWMDKIAVRTRGGRMTQRAAQDMLDSHTTYEPTCGMDESEWRFFYLQALQTAREERM